MKFLFSLLAPVFLSQLLFGQITVTFVAPENNLVDTNIVQVKARVTPGEYELTSVVATIDNRSVTLINIGVYFQGNLSTSGLTIDSTYALTVTATDAMGNQGTATKNVIVDPPPKINIQFPVNHEVATPQLHIKAVANDNSDCSIAVHLQLYLNNGSMMPYIRLDTFMNSVDTVIFLSDSIYQGGSGYVRFYVTDSRGQIQQADREINIENSPYLEKVFSTEGIIKDFNYGKVLSNFNSYPPDNSRGPNIANISTGVMLAPPIDGLLTPTGIVNSVSEWINDTLYVFGSVGASNDQAFKVAGVYAIWTKWTDQNTLYFRNTATHSTRLISGHANVESFNIAANGTVVFSSDSSGQSGVYRFANGASARIDPNGWGVPATDGKNIVYPASSGIYLYNGSVTAQLGTSGNSKSKVVNGFVAYTQTGPSGQEQIWLRDTTGIKSQKTFYSTSSIINDFGDGLGADGSICFYRNIQNSPKYLYERDSNKFKAISASRYNKMYYRDSSWYMSIGRVLFKVKSNFINSYYTVKNGNWSNPATWYGNAVPPAGADVTVGNNVTVDIDATCNTLTVKGNAQVTVNTGINLVVLH